MGPLRTYWSSGADGQRSRSEQLPQLFQAQRRKRNASREIWSLMQFAIWHRLFVEQPGVQPGSDEDPLDWIG